ncbi:hypothetical protein IHE45_08G134700 [Dioscorea alata]|uniref:Uncharacterized protein n=1 Tax=Dioscorea alata TaxID=55571 RepID=A0ACB7VMF2_DIOAL|nr:hypothetical protein IHE45_08G134700 [Dioscorea alata]
MMMMMVMVMMRKRSWRITLAMKCLFCCICFLLVFAINIESVEIGGERLMKLHAMHSSVFLDSKRGVPNGPDPIHNRREGKSGRRPGRV